MNSTPAKRSYYKMLYGPSQEKTLHNLLKRELVINFGFENKLKIADVLIDSMLTIIDNYGCDVDKLQPYQILWPAVDKDDYPGYGKSMDKIKHKSIVLTLWTKDELEKLANGTDTVILMKERIARLCKESYAQDTLLSMTDVALMLNISPSRAAQLRAEWEMENNEILKTRGSYHDLGMTMSHKKQIVKEHLKGLLPSEIARKHKHEISSVDRYIRVFERTLPLFQENQSIAKIAFYTRMSEKLVICNYTFLESRYCQRAAVYFHNIQYRASSIQHLWDTFKTSLQLHTANSNLIPSLLAFLASLGYF